MHKKPVNVKAIIISACVVIAVAVISGLAYMNWYEANLEAQRIELAEREAQAALAAALAAELEAEKARIAEETLKALTVKAKRPLMEVNIPAPPPPVPRQNILDWQARNPDTIGYITIENSKVNYPVVQGADNDYYLNYTFDHIKATRGSIFLDSTIDYDPYNLPKHFIIHGHHMKDGSMFHNVARYKDKKFFFDHPYIRLETLYYDTVWRVFSVYVCGSNEYVPPMFRTDDTFLAYARKTADRSLFSVDMEFAAEDRIMTLNTCSYEFNGAHTLVVAKLVEIIED